MVHIVRSAAIAPGKLGDAIAFAQNISRYIEDKYGIALEELMPIGGNPSRIAWHATYESLAQWEDLTTRWLRDTAYMEMLAKNSATFLPGSVHDDIWRTL
jgi:hypothetical protein